jgi:hypothetical protein
MVAFSWKLMKEDLYGWGTVNEWSDSQVENVAQNIKKTDSRDTNVILEMVEEFLPSPIRDAL